MNNPNTPNYGPQNVNQPYPPQSPQKPKWSTKKKFGVGAAIVLGIGVIGGAIGGGTSGSSDSSDKPAVSAQVEDHATYEVEQQRTKTAPAPKATPETNKPKFTGPESDAYPGLRQNDIDDIFIEHIEDDGINVPRQVAIDAARDGVCFFAGTVDSGEALLLIVTESTGLPMNQAAVFSGAAVAAYCPQHMDIVLNDQVA